MTSSTELHFVHEYMQDAWQRLILTLDVLRERGNIVREHNARAAPNVLQFQAQPVMDGRSLPRPVNYLLTRIVPPKGVKIDPAKPPFIIVDPRAGHGPGIGGMKADSEIGVAINAGHPCYYIGFLPDPIPGQTIEDVCVAEAAFVKKVAELHRDADTKPVVIANCQAGWQIMMVAATNPDLFGPILLAGSPLSYWAGVHGKNPMRYTGGMLGGSWLATMTGDLGHGIFDGAHLVANFESLEPANTYWDKPYNVYSKADTEGPRFLGFETWWGSPVLLNAEEMQWIVDNLFVGNKLRSGELQVDGQAVDLRNVRSPIIIFCSWGDNITPPQQALGWITDFYKDDREIALNGQTIVYTMHQSIGHLGIFVSGKVATKEHKEFTQCMDLIYMTPPGLYEAVIIDVDEDTTDAELVEGKYVFRLEKRTLDDIRALGGNSEEDERRFEAVARLSEINQDMYQAFAAPALQAMNTELSSIVMRYLHPNRLRFALFSDQNPFIKPIGEVAKAIREVRTPVSPDNPLLAMEKLMSSLISGSWETYRVARDAMTEMMFMNIYGWPMLQTALGVEPQAESPAKSISLRLAYDAKATHLRQEMEERFETGGLIEAVARALAYVGRPAGTIDERNFNMLKKFRNEQPAETRRPIGALKKLLTEQITLVRLDEERAIQAIPKLLPKGQKKRQAALDSLRKVLKAGSALPVESERRLARIESLFDEDFQSSTIMEVKYG